MKFSHLPDLLWITSTHIVFFKLIGSPYVYGVFIIREEVIALFVIANILMGNFEDVKSLEEVSFFAQVARIESLFASLPFHLFQAAEARNQQ